MNDTLQNLMREATRLTRSGQLGEATRAIQRALQGSRQSSGVGQVPDAAASPGMNAPTAQEYRQDPIILDDCVFEIPQPSTPAAKHEGAFTEGSHTHASLTRRYKLYAPPGSAGGTGKSLPLVVMLHGCTQNPDDFAAGTGMNERAREQGFYVLYPAQSADANPQRCWNWFKHTHQSRGRGEAALLASMTLSIMQQHGIDARRVYIAGLSAGGAMAAIVAAAYPEIYAAVGVHSGLAVGAASNVAEALAAMRGGANFGANVGENIGENIGAKAFTGGSARNGQGGQQDHAGSAVPTIVFHGDQDRTVHPRNGEQVCEQVIASVQGGAGQSVTQDVEHGVSSGGRRFTRSVHRSGNGQTVAEHWRVNGAAHAWSGGHAPGSYTDPKGPDATGEMLRFFLAHPHPKNP